MDMFSKIPDTGRNMSLRKDPGNILNKSSSTTRLSITSTKTSPEVEDPDVQLDFVFGNTFAKPQPKHIPPEDTEPQDYPAEMLCLSRSMLKHVPDSILKNSTLKYLYLEGNQICSIPDSLFVSLPDLLWLDLRKNLIESLPAEIGSHRSLKTLLLEGNPISELPPELGNVITLKGLNLRDCPIRFPPPDVVQQGLQSILQYLRSALAQRPVSERKTPPELPVVEKLQLSELMGQDESVDDDELQKFRELKQKLIQLDKAELGSVAQGDKTPKSHLLPITRRKKTTTRAALIPELPLHWRRPEERRQAAMKELKEKQAVLEQRRKSKEALHKWRTQAKITQEKRQKKQERQRKREVVAEPKLMMRQQQIPAAATERAASLIENQHHEAEPGSPQGQTFGTSKEECEEDRSPRELERQIRARVERIQERRGNPRGTASEQMAAAEKDLDEMRKLQTRLLDRKKSRGKDLEDSFIIFTGNTWPSFLDK